MLLILHQVTPIMSFYCLPVGTGFLWWTYVDIKNQIEKDEAVNLPLLDVEINSERAFLIYSIVSTVLTVSTWYHFSYECKS